MGAAITILSLLALAAAGMCIAVLHARLTLAKKSIVNLAAQVMYMLQEQDPDGFLRLAEKLKQFSERCNQWRKTGHV